MQFETTVFTVVIPLSFDPADFMQMVHVQKAEPPVPGGSLIPAPGQKQPACFSDCFCPKPLARTLQLEDSPFMRKGKEKVVARFDLSQSQRGQLGIHRNQNCVYTLVKENIRFYIKQVRLWAFRWGAAFLTLEIVQNGLTDQQVLDLTARLCDTRLPAAVSFRQALGKDRAETRTFTMRALIENFMAMQAFVQFSPCKNETLKKACGLFMGVCHPDEGHPVFLETLRSQRRSCLRACTGIEEEDIFRPFSHVHWVAGERMLAVIGDLDSADAQCTAFLRDKGGLRRTVTENYLLLYLHYLSVKFYASRMVKACEDIDRGAAGTDPQQTIRQMIALRRIPVTDLSSEEHINRLFESHLCGHTWQLRDSLERLGTQYLPDLIRSRPCDIFISYRRKGGFYLARLLYTMLEARQKKTFLDMERLGPGRFDEHIYEVLERCRVVLVVLTKDCLNCCANKEDWMRREIVKALEQKKAGRLEIIPIMVDDFEFPKILPEDMDISRQNAVRFTPQSFRGDFEMLCRFIDEA